MGPYYIPHLKISISLLVLWHNGGISSKNHVFRVAFSLENQAKRGKIEKIKPLLICTVETTSFATLKLDSPPLIFMYYLPYEIGELKKFVFYSDH